MIVGWFFMISNQVINSDSNYKFMKGMLDGMLKAGKDDLYVVFMPHSPYVRYEPDGFFRKHPKRVLPIVYNTPSQKTLQALYFPSQFFYDMTSKYGLNVYFNNIPEIAAQLSNFINAYSDATPYQVVYNHYTIHPTLPYPMYAYTHLRLLGILGNYLADMVVFNTEYHYQMFKDNLREFNLHAWIPDIEEKLKLVPIPVLDSELKPFYDQTPPFKYDPSNVVFYYNHRLQVYKQWELTFNVLLDLWRSGYRNFRVNLSYASGDHVQDAQQRYPFIKLVYSHTHAEYYRRLMQPHFNTTNTTHETFCIAIVESALLGGIPIVPKRVTFPEIFPKNYPLFFESVDEQREIIKNVLSGGYSQDFFIDLKAKLREHFSKFNSDDVGRLMYNLIASEFNAKATLERMKDPRAMYRFFERHAGEEMEFWELYNKAKREVKLGSQAMPSWKFSMILENFPHRKYFSKNKLVVRLNG